jgi:inosine-uridine nucleoside N-ribohydrolase
LGTDRGPAAIIRHATARPGEITLVCCGPLTNLAIALNVEPNLPSLLGSVIVMGGSYWNPGNVTAHAEFNIFVDPEAAAQVFDTAFSELTLVGLDVTHRVGIDRIIWEQAGKSDSRAAALLHRTYADSLARTGAGGYVHDAMAVAIAADPSLATYESGTVGTVIDGDEQGKTTLDAGNAGVKVARAIDIERFIAMFAGRLDLEW